MIQAVEDKVIVEELVRAKTEGGLVIPKTAMVDPQGYGRVMSVGTKVSGIKEGDVISFHLRAGMAAVFKGQTFRIVKIEEIYGIVTDKDIISQLDIVKLEALNEKPIIIE